jgi:ATP-binding protein involved in chromosome partitioning
MVFGLSKKDIDLDEGGKREALMKALAGIDQKDLGKDLISLGMIGELSGKGGKITVEVIHPSHALHHKEEDEAAIKEAVKEVYGVEPTLEIGSRVKSATGPSSNKEGLDGIANVVLVASGKGGVGKSTVAANLAVALSELGCKVGLLDADVYGPSVPTMFGLQSGVRPSAVPNPENPERPRMVPLDRFGVKLISIGFLVDTSTPMVWRGPMIASAAMQLFRDVEWGELDYLIVDLPPGTGDIHLTISQQVVVAGSVVVSTPQDVALADVVRAKAMFDKVNIPSLGVVENMSYFVCDNCDKRHEIFTHGGAKKAAAALGQKFLGEIPIELDVRAGGDEGAPVVVRNPESAAADAFLELARNVATQLAHAAEYVQNNAAAAGPSLSISGAPKKGDQKKKGGLPVIG